MACSAPEHQTPCLLLDLPKVRRNIERMHQRLAALGVDLRPHGKTAKNIDVMRLALAGQSGGVTVSTLKEAEYYFEHGVTDLIYAVGIAPQKLARVAALMESGAAVTLLLDSLAQVEMLNEAGRQMQQQFSALIEIDCDGHRSGLAPGCDELIVVAESLAAAPMVDFRGVLTHAGGSYACRSVAELRQMAETERLAAVTAAERIRAAGISCPVVSVGSTPTATFAQNLDGVTEVRAGVFVFQDLVMTGLGVCGAEDVGLSVLTSVIGHQASKDWIMIDAGWMALSRDRGTADHELDQGYGLVCAADGSIFQDLIVVDTNQEHGVIADRHGRAIDPNDFPVGTQLRILPNHACATSAMFDHYIVLDAESPAEPQRWDRIHGW